MKPEYLLSGRLEETNEAYAMAKLAGMKLCQAYRSQYGCNFITAIPSTPFGPHSHFNPDEAHVIEGLMTRMHQAKLSSQKEVVIWGTGKPRRDFIYSADLASACAFLMNSYNDPAPINIGLNCDYSIAEVAEKIKAVTNFRGALSFDTNRPDGMPLKRLDASHIRTLGWKPAWTFEAGLAATYDSYVNSAKPVNDG